MQKRSHANDSNDPTSKRHRVSETQVFSFSPEHRILNAIFDIVINYNQNKENRSHVKRLRGSQTQSRYMEEFKSYMLSKYFEQDVGKALITYGFSGQELELLTAIIQHRMLNSVNYNAQQELIEETEIEIHEINFQNGYVKFDENRFLTKDYAMKLSAGCIADFNWSIDNIEADVSSMEKEIEDYGELYEDTRKLLKQDLLRAINQNPGLGL